MAKNPLSKFSELILTMNPYEMSVLAFILGALLCEGLDGQQQEAIGNFYELVGQTILTLGAQYENLEQYQTPPNVEKVVDTLKNKIGNLESIIAEFRKL